MTLNQRKIREEKVFKQISVLDHKTFTEMTKLLKWRELKLVTGLQESSNSFVLSWAAIQCDSYCIWTQAQVWTMTNKLLF